MCLKAHSVEIGEHTYSVHILSSSALPPKKLVGTSARLSLAFVVCVADASFCCGPFSLDRARDSTSCAPCRA